MNTAIGAFSVVVAMPLAGQWLNSPTSKPKADP
jgi:hypothetical protein